MDLIIFIPMRKRLKSFSTRDQRKGTSSLKIKDGFVIRRVGDSFVAVATGKAAESFKGMITLNSTAALLWADMQNGLPLDEMVAHLCDEYEVDALRAREDVETLCADLIDAGIIE